MQNRYKSSWSQAPAGEPPSLPSPYLPMYTRPRWLRHPCRVGEYPCGGYRQVRVGQTSWYASVRRQLEKQRHVSMVLVQHGSKGEKTPRGGEGQRESRTLGDRGGERKEKESAPFRYSTLHPPSPAVRAATPVHQPSRPAPLARCAVRALGRVRARVPPLPPCLRGWTGAGGPRVGRGQVVEPVDRQRVDGRGRHGCANRKRVGYSSGEASDGRMSSGGGGVVVGGT